MTTKALRESHDQFDRLMSYAFVCWEMLTIQIIFYGILYGLRFRQIKLNAKKCRRIRSRR